MRKIFLFVVLCFLIIRSTPADAQWIVQTTNTTQNLRSLVMLSPSDGWAAGAGSTLLNTSNGGKLWAPISTGTAGNYNSITFNDFSGVQGWIVGEMPKILSTIDGGSTWSAVPSGTTSALNSIQLLPSGLLGWAVGNAGTIVGTIDGGTTWKPETSGITTNLNSVVFVGDELTSLGRAVGDKGALLTTTDNGATWVRKALPTDKNLYAIDMFDANNGWIVGDQIILHTSDGGANWNVEPFANPVALHAVTILDTATAYVAGDGGRLLKTMDGKTWVDKPTGSTHALYGVRFQGSRDSGWVAGDQGTILFNANPSAVRSEALLAESLSLSQNYPNPFNSVTTIAYHLATPSWVRLSIYDQVGRLISIAVDEKETEGDHRITWDASPGGRLLNSGVFFCRLETGGLVMSRKLILAR
jgi:photosystem II stability/assembly factor-like uncharacterized protein